jgi:hypothetical protein
MIELDNDDGLSHEEFEISYNPLIPEWKIQCLSTTLNWIKINRKHSIRLDQEGEALVLETNDVIEFKKRIVSELNGTKYRASYHKLKVIALEVTSRDKRDYEFEQQSFQRQTQHSLLTSVPKLIAGAKQRQDVSFVVPFKRGGFSLIYQG